MRIVDEQRLQLIIISAWCNSTCPGFCELMNGFYQCNCMKYPGFEYSDDGKQCLRKIYI